MTQFTSPPTTSRRAITAEEIAENQKIFEEYFDPQYAQSLVKNVVAPINERYFKCQFIGFESLPERNNPERPLIYVSNHSGMAFPWDAMVFSGMMFMRQNFSFHHAVRPLSAPMLSQSNLMNPYLIKDFWKRNGAVDATFKNFETMLYYREANIMIYPEGVAGIGKGFNRRYQLQRFATSFVRMALKYQTDIIPYATVNGEFINPYVYSLPKLNRLVQKVGIPYIPVGFHTILLLIFPWLFYFALPAQLTYVMGKRIRPYEWVDKPYDQLSEEDIMEVRDRIKDQMQQELDDAVARFGKKRFSSGKIIANSLKNILTLNYYAPPGWPILFHEHHRRYVKSQGRPFEMKINFWSGLKYLFKNPFTIAFYIPLLGWIPLLIRGYRKHRLGN
ncbi:MAG: 1-acyl-sn-glycerol-3-phosphate acyltransferase [Cyclobacteriaceae bacterium]|nr:1-acyl-sn-glycerol-3-phosphate acyltransferase [Cyclobacteriaceae bacterium]